MLSVFTAAVLALLGTAPVDVAQSAPVGPQAAPSAAKVMMTLSGCLSDGPAPFVLSNVIAVGSPSAGEGGKKPAGTPALSRSYDLVPREGLSLAPYAGHRVEVTGSVVEAKPGGDEAAGAAGQKTAAGRRPAPRFAVTAVKSVSPICLQ